MKILVTIGPISENESSLKKILNKTNLLRVNGSHNSLNWHKNITKKIKRISPNCKILLDIPGVKPRTMNSKDLFIGKNEKIYFSYKKKISNKNIKNILLSNPIPQLKTKNKYLSVSDGLYLFKIIKISKNYIQAMSLQSFTLNPFKGLNIPGSTFSEALQKTKYLDFLKKIKNKKILFDAIGLSFIQNHNLVRFIKNKFKDKIIISKIENVLGLKNIDSIIKYSDVIMIDRGDLGAEIKSENLYSAIDLVIDRCKKQNTPVIVATENLNSMMRDTEPSKSDIVNISHLASLNVDTIMLSDETAISKNYYKIIKWLDNFINKTKQLQRDKKYKPKVKVNNNEFLFEFYNNLNKNFKDLPLILFTKKGYFVKDYLNSSSNKNFFIFTTNKMIEKIYSFSYKTKIFYIQKFDNNRLNFFIYNEIRKVKNKIFKKNKLAILIYTNYPRKGSKANNITLLNKEDFK